MLRFGRLRCFLLLPVLMSPVFSPAAEGVRYETLTIDASHIGVMFDADDLWDRRDVVLPWIERSAEIVVNYFGAFPVETVFVAIASVEGNQVVNGSVIGGEQPVINVRVGRDVDAASLTSDWIMVHEMVHLAFPDVKIPWIEEGVATYVESVARVHVGDLSARKVWHNFMTHAPLGQPQHGDRGLNATPVWGRVYWGGTAFCLLADIEIRRRTDNRYGLQDALKAILSAGYDITRRADVVEALRVGDGHIGVPVLMELYARYGQASKPFDLDGTWRKLGLELDGDSVRYDDNAPLAWVRRAITPDFHEMH